MKPSPLNWKRRKAAIVSCNTAFGLASIMPAADNKCYTTIDGEIRFGSMNALKCVVWWRHLKELERWTPGLIKTLYPTRRLPHEHKALPQRSAMGMLRRLSESLHLLPR